MPCLEHLRLSTGQLVTEDWYDDLCDFLCEIGYGGIISAYGYAQADIVPLINCAINLGLPLKQFFKVHAQYGYFQNQIYIDGHYVIKDGDCLTISDFGADAEQDLEDGVKEGLDTSVDIEAIKASVASTASSVSGLADLFKPVLLGKVWEEDIGAMEDVFTPDKLVLFSGRTRVKFSSAYYVYAYLKHQALGEGVPVTSALNAGVGIPSRAWHEFDFTNMAGDYVNLAFTPNTEITLMLYNIPNA
ncbi:hypothetical protein ES705_34313 [subsurface metagenome]